MMLRTNIDVNKIIIVGQLEPIPDVRYTKSGLAVLNLKVRITRNAETTDGGIFQDKIIISTALWGRKAEIYAQSLHEGETVQVIGQLEYRTFTDQQGVEHNFTQIKVKHLYPLNDGRKNDRKGTFVH